MNKTDSPYDQPFGGSVEKRALYEYHLARDCILPLLTRWDVEIQGARVLDLGCGGGGLAVAMAESGATCWGVDLRPERIASASRMAADHGVTVHLVACDVLEMGDLGEVFDLIVLSEVVEHLENLPNVEALLGWCRDHLAADGRVYVSFPPWFSPFAGHQAGWPRIRCIPWYHLLPSPVKRLLAPEDVSAYLKFAEELNHLTIGRFEHLLQETTFVIGRRELYLIRTEFRHRYGLPELRSSLLARIPALREVLTTGAYYLLRDGDKCHLSNSSRADVKLDSRRVEGGR